MNPPEKIDEQQLEWASSRQLPADAKLDDEHTLLREGWDSFCTLIGAAQAEDIPAVLPAIGTAKDGLVKDSLLKDGWKSRWPRAIGVLAATLLIGLATGWVAFRPSLVDPGLVSELPKSAPVPVRAGDPAPVYPGLNSHVDAGAVGGYTDVATAVDVSGDPADPYAWEDSWDEEVALAEQALWELQWSWNSVDLHVESVYEDIEQYESVLGSTNL